MGGPRVFISYSHEDEAWKDELLKHLRVFEREGLLEIWDDRRIGAGTEWLAAITEAISQAKVAVLLVSVDFLNSEFIRELELPLLAARAEHGLRIFPVILRDCAWQKVPWLARLQVRPTDDKSLANRPETQREALWTTIAQEILGIVQTEEPPSKPPPVEPPPSERPPVSAFQVVLVNLLVGLLLFLLFWRGVPLKVACFTGHSRAFFLAILGMLGLHVGWHYFGSSARKFGGIRRVFAAFHPKGIPALALWALTAIVLALCWLGGWSRFSPFRLRDPVPRSSNLVVERNAAGYFSVLHAGGVVNARAGEKVLLTALPGMAGVHCEWQSGAGEVLESSCSTAYTAPSDRENDLLILRILSPCETSELVVGEPIRIIPQGPE